MIKSNVDTAKFVSLFPSPLPQASTGSPRRGMKIAARLIAGFFPLPSATLNEFFSESHQDLSPRPRFQRAK